MAQVYEAIFEIFDRGVHVHQQFKGSFTWKDDDPSARIILEGSFGLREKRGSWDQLFIWITCKIVFNAVAKQDGGGSNYNDKSVVDNCLSASVCRYVSLTT